MGRFYGVKIKNKEINPKTGEAWKLAFPMSSVIFAKGHILIPVPYGSQPWAFRIAGYLD